MNWYSAVWRELVKTIYAFIPNLEGIEVPSRVHSITWELWSCFNKQWIVRSVRVLLRLLFLRPLTHVSNLRHVGKFSWPVQREGQRAAPQYGKAGLYRYPPSTGIDIPGFPTQYRARTEAEGRFGYSHIIAFFFLALTPGTLQSTRHFSSPSWTPQLRM